MFRILSITYCCVFWLGFTLIAHGISSPVESWSYQAGEQIEGAPKFYPSTENPTHVIVVSKDGVVSMVDATGRAVWKTDLDRECLSPVGIGDLDADGTPEIVVGFHDGNAIALDAQGQERWRYKMQGFISNYRCPMLVDLDGDGQCAVILTDNLGNVVCLSPDGKRLWQFKIDPYYASPAAAADLDLDGEMEIVYGTENNRVVCLTSRGTVKWVRSIEGKYARTAPSLSDIDGDGYLDVVVTMSFNNPKPKISVLSGPTGEVLWRSPIDMWAYASNTIADLDRDGSPEIICCGRGRRIHVLNADGSLRWKKISDVGGSYKEVAIADLDGDGHLEIINGCRFGPGIEVYSVGGEPILQFGEGICHNTPLIGDLDGDGRIELITTRQNTGELLCYDCEGSADSSSILWAAYRKDSGNTGAVLCPNPAHTPYKADRSVASLDVTFPKVSVWGENHAQIHWPVSLPERILLEVTVDPHQGASRIDVITLQNQSLPVSIPCQIEYAGRHSVTFTLRNAEDGRAIASATAKSKNSGIKSLERWMEPKLQEMEDISERIAKTASGIALQIRHLQAKHTATLASISRITDFFKLSDKEHDNIIKRITTMRTEADNHLRLARLLRNTSNGESLPPVLLWTDLNPWDEACLWDTIEDAFPPKDVEISTWMYRSEYEDVALNLLNITPNPITVQIRTENTIAEHVSVREAIQVPRYDGTWVLDALSELNAAHTIQLAPGEIRQLWFVCDSRKLDAGVHDLPIELLVLGHENTTFNAKIQIEVEDIDLAATPPFMRCNWSSAARLRRQGLDDRLIKRYIESGMNVLYLSMPGRRCGEQGQLIGTADWSATDRELAMMAPDCFFFISIGIQTPKGVKEGDPIWSKAFRAWADEVTEHLESKGFPISQWAVYPVDEPGLYDGPRIQELMEKIKPIKAAAPDVPIYANPSSEVTVENFSEMAHYIDVWCPELGVLLRRPEMVDFFLQDKSKRVWCYEAPSSVKFLHPLGYYRSQALTAFAFGLQGSGYWTTVYHDIWKNLVAEEYGVIYGKGGTFVESRRWHATRDGSEDARALYYLKQLTEKGRKKGLAADLCAQAETLMGSDLFSILERPMEADDVTRYIIEDYDPKSDDLLSLRKRAAELTLRFQVVLNK